MALLLMLACTLLASTEYSPVLVVSADLIGDVGIRKDRKVTVGLRLDGGTLNILVFTKANTEVRIADRLEQAGTEMLVEHALAKCPVLLPFIAAVLYCRTY